MEMASRVRASLIQFHEDSIWHAGEMRLVYLLRDNLAGHVYSHETLGGFEKSCRLSGAGVVRVQNLVEPKACRSAGVRIARPVPRPGGNETFVAPGNGVVSHIKSVLLLRKRGNHHS